LKTGVIAQYKFPDQTPGYYRIDIPITNRRIAGLTDNNYRFRIAVSHAADLDYRAIKILLFKLVFYCPEHFQGSGGPTAGGGADHNYWLAIIPKFPPA
jgi:hypothetical protein